MRADSDPPPLPNRVELNFLNLKVKLYNNLYSHPISMISLMYVRSQESETIFNDVADPTTRQFDLEMCQIISYQPTSIFTL